MFTEEDAEAIFDDVRGDAEGLAFNPFVDCLFQIAVERYPNDGEARAAHALRAPPSCAARFQNIHSRNDLSVIILLLLLLLL